MESCLYAGQVKHRRHGTPAHSFAYQLGMLYLDLAELPELFDGYALWSARRPAFAWFRRADHMGDPERALDDCVRDLVARELGSRPAGPVRLLTHPRYAGYCFNPLSLYYCFDASGERVESVVAEVSNTPWRERHCYVLAAGERDERDPLIHAEHAKAFHVSPFLPMRMDYVWRLSTPGERLLVHIDTTREGERVMDASLSLEQQPIGHRTMAAFLAQHPLMTMKVTAAIHIEAWRLWRKGVAVHTHPRKLRNTRTEH